MLPLLSRDMLSLRSLLVEGKLFLPHNSAKNLIRFSSSADNSRRAFWRASFSFWDNGLSAGFAVAVAGKAIAAVDVGGLTAFAAAAGCLVAKLFAEAIAAGP